MKPSCLTGRLCLRTKNCTLNGTVALIGTFVPFEDEAGNPLSSRNVVIQVSATAAEIIGIDRRSKPWLT